MKNIQLCFVGEFFRWFALVWIIAVTASCSSSHVISLKDNEIFNVGFGEMNRDASGYAVGSVVNRRNEASAYTNIFDYIRARVPGVWMDYADYGDTPNIYIRGTTSIHSPHQPLFMVDGRQVDSIANINPNDVRSVTVLKDAIAALYGIQGANGVIQIWTKRGADVD